MEKSNGINYQILKQRIVLLRIIDSQADVPIDSLPSDEESLRFHQCIYILQELFQLPLKFKFTRLPLVDNIIWSQDLQEELDTMLGSGMLKLKDQHLCVSRAGVVLMSSLPKVTDSLNQKYNAHFKFLGRHLMAMKLSELQSLTRDCYAMVAGSTLGKEQIDSIDSLVILAKECGIKSKDFDVSETAKEDRAITGFRGKPPTKKDMWLYYYLDQTNPKTFLNITRSARAAGYNCKTADSFYEIGRHNLKVLAPTINEWLDDFGLSENVVKLKLAQLMEATEKVFFSHQGKVTDEREIKALQIQLQAARFVMKIRGMDAPQKHEHSGPAGKPLECRITPDMSAQEASDAYSQVLREIKGE